MAEEATDVKENVEQITTEPDSSTEETKESGVDTELIDEDDVAAAEKKAADEITKDLETEDKKKESDEDSEDDEDKTDETEEDKPEEKEVEETDDDQPKKNAETRKEELQTEIRDLVAKRNVLREEVEATNAKVYEPQTAEELIEQGMDPAMARVESLEQGQKMDKFNAHVTDLNANLNVESLQVMADFPIFNPDAPEYDKTLAETAKNVYQRAAQIQTDPNTGLVVQANVLPYEIYKAIADARTSGANQGAAKGQKAAEKMLASADTPSSSAPKQPKEDPFLKGLTGG